MSQEQASWVDLFGATGKALPVGERKANWGRFLGSAPKELRDCWDSAEACQDCIHLEQSAFSWCARMGLPCAVNPILTMRHGMIGMACMGAGKEIKEQMEMSL